MEGDSKWKGGEGFPGNFTSSGAPLPRVLSDLVPVPEGPTFSPWPYLSVGIFGLQIKGTDYVDADQAFLGAPGWELVELARGHWQDGVIRQGVNLEGPLQRDQGAVDLASWECQFGLGGHRPP